MAHAAMACTFVTYRGWSAIRDVGKALGLPPAFLEDVALAYDRDDAVPVTSDVVKTFVELCEQIQGFPRHLGIHNGGMIITNPPLSSSPAYRTGDNGKSVRCSVG